VGGTKLAIEEKSPASLVIGEEPVLIRTGGWFAHWRLALEYSARAQASQAMSARIWLVGGLISSIHARFGGGEKRGVVKI
jgi:hypothetical protein